MDFIESVTKRIPWSQRVGHDCATFTFFFHFATTLVGATIISGLGYCLCIYLIPSRDPFRQASSSLRLCKSFHLPKPKSQSRGEGPETPEHVATLACPLQPHQPPHCFWSTPDSPTSGLSHLLFSWLEKFFLHVSA